jgi:UDP-3-O-[3-hydroxymyristoyl] glucosamine N-acyltransferase
VLDELWPHFGRGTNLIFESNSVVHHVRPGTVLWGTPARPLPQVLREIAILGRLAKRGGKGPAKDIS